MDENATTAEKPVTQFCMLKTQGKYFSGSLTIDVDFGTANSSFVKYDVNVVQQTLKVRQLGSLIDTLNYMAWLGWELVRVMPYDSANGDTLDDHQYLYQRLR